MKRQKNEGTKICVGIIMAGILFSYLTYRLDLGGHMPIIGCWTISAGFAALPFSRAIDTGAWKLGVKPSVQTSHGNDSTEKTVIVNKLKKPNVEETDHKIKNGDISRSSLFSDGRYCLNLGLYADIFAAGFKTKKEATKAKSKLRKLMKEGGVSAYYRREMYIMSEDELKHTIIRCWYDDTNFYVFPYSKDFFFENWKQILETNCEFGLYKS